MQIAKKSKEARPPYIARFFVALTLLAGVYCLYELDNANKLYDRTLAQLGSVSTIRKKLTVGSSTIAIPSFELFRNGSLWTYVGKEKALPPSTKVSLVDIPVAHGDANKSMQVASHITRPLENLFAAAKADGLPLMVASAYRSREDQQKLYDGFMTQRGQAFTVSRVAKPGTSEHQSGLAVDISSASPACSTDSDKCELNVATIGWLAKNAPRFGFIQRYPMGKQSITGFSNEEWHYRYVGVPLAKALTASGLTFDEFVEQAAPGYKK